MTGKKGRWTKGAKSTPREKQRFVDQNEEYDENNATQQSQPLPVENKLFEEYYVSQGVLTQDEVEKFMEFIKKPLPLSFRLAMDKSNVRELVRVLKRDYFPKLTELGAEGGVLQPPTNIPWVSDESMWQMQLDESVDADNKILQDFKTFLYQQTQCGNIIQQDVGSMLPACLLDVKPHHNVLDLRASPGYRAVQLVQLLHSDEKVPNPDGVVIANETHLKRCFAMGELIKQYFSPNFAMVNMDANSLPSLFLSGGTDPKPLVYDRIVCGFPSSGDGMFRNNLDGLRCWTANMPLSHHPHLTQMLYSGMSSLEIGGRLVFFIYSMNPVEAEAVAYAVIMQQRGTVELVDVSKEMPADLIYEKGLHSWRVMAKGPRWFREFEEVPEHLHTMVWLSMFPPSKEEAERVGLDRCIRVLPHKQNTVGLFIAVFTRTSSLYEAYQREQEEQQKAYEAAEEARRLEEARLLEEKKKLEEERKKKAEEKKRLREEEKKKEAEKKRLEEEEEKKKKETEETETAKESDKKDEVEDPEAVKEKDAAEEDKAEKKAEEGEKKAGEGEAKQAEVVVVEEGKGERKAEAVVEAEVREEGTAVEVDESKEEESVEMAGEDRTEKDGKNGFEDDYGEGGNGAAVTAADESGNYYSNTQQVEDGAVKAGDADDTRRSRIDGQFDFFDADNKLWLQLKDFYGLSDDFPYMRVACRPVSGLKQHFVLVTDTIKKIVENNQSLFSFVHVGVKLFAYMKQPNAACNYRLAMEGLPTILPYMSKRVVTVSKRDFIAVVSSHNPTVEGLTVKTKKEVTNLDKGGFAFVLEPDRAKNSHKCQVIVSAWKDEDTAYRTFLPTYLRLHYLRVAGANMNDYEDHPETHQDIENAMAAFAKSFPL